MDVAIFAPDLTGHRLHWLRQILLCAEESDVNVFVYTCCNLRDFEGIEHYGLNMKYLVFENQLKTLFARWYSEVEDGKFVGVVWESDKILHKLVFARGKYRLLILRPYLEKKNFFGMLRYLFKQSLILFLSQRRALEIARLSIPYAHKESSGFHWVRDDMNTERFIDLEKAREIPVEMNEIPAHAKIISLLGYIDERKNPLKAYKIVDEFRKQSNYLIFLVVAGEQSIRIKSQLLEIKNVQGLILIDRVLSGSELRGVIGASQIVLLPYSNRGASGIVLNSLALGTPVILQGGHNWRNLQKVSDKIVRIEGANSRRMVMRLWELIDYPKKSVLNILESEPIPRLSDFLLIGSR